jgi:hypothetical protein
MRLQNVSLIINQRVHVAIEKLRLAQLGRFLRVERAHLTSSSRFGMGAYSGFNGVVFSMVGDIPVDSEALVMTLSISKCTDIVFQRCS